MPNYQISLSPAPEAEVTALLQGPGLQPDGKPFVFATPQRARSFAEAVNFAYEQGVRDGMRRLEMQDTRKLMVCGRTPETLGVRPERWFDRLVRQWRGLRSRRG
jgi:hypothetical protein